MWEEVSLAEVQTDSPETRPQSPGTTGAGELGPRVKIKMEERTFLSRGDGQG